MKISLLSRQRFEPPTVDRESYYAAATPFGVGGVGSLPRYDRRPHVRDQVAGFGVCVCYGNVGLVGVDAHWKIAIRSGCFVTGLGLVGWFMAPHPLELVSATHRFPVYRQRIDFGLYSPETNQRTSFSGSSSARQFESDSVRKSNSSIDPR